MKIVWLEQMTKEGSVSEAARDAIYADCIGIVKLAQATSKLEKFENWVVNMAKEHPAAINALEMAAGGAIGGVVASTAIKPIRNFFSGKTILKDIDNVKKQVLSQPDMAIHREKALARLEELIRIAPSVARNPELTSRILKEKMHSGFTSDDVQSLAQIQAAYTPNMKDQTALSKKMTQLSSKTKIASERRTGETLATVLTMCKEAGISGKTLSKALENTLLASSIPVLGGVGIGAVNYLVGRSDKKKMEAALTKSFQAAVNGSDSERDGLKENEEKARQYFQILAHFSPHVALQPEAARSFMSKMTHYDSTGRGAVQVEDIKNLSDIQHNYASGRKGTPFFEGLAAGSKALGLDSALKSGVAGISRPLNADLAMRASADLDMSHGDLKDFA